jgi:dTDP-glucose 4,6-dehydratase
LADHNRRVLVTGGAGFIGANFVHYWHRTYPRDTLTVIDALTYAGNPASIAAVPNTDLVKGNICDTALVEQTLRERQIDTIVHFAAESHVDRSINSPDLFIETNIVGTHSLLKAARNVWLEGSGSPHLFHHVSTDEVYGSLGPEDPAFSETTPYAPNSPYAASKAASDHMVRAYFHTYGLQVTTSNCSNNYGPYQYPEKLIPLFLINALSGRALPVYGDGLNVRDWLHVVDHCRGIEAVIRSGKAGETYNIGGGEELPNLAVIENICAGVDAAFVRNPELAARFPNAPAAKGQKTAILKTFVEDRKGHDRRYAIDETKARSEIGFEPTFNFEDGLSSTLDWYLHNESWWRPLLNR